MGDSISCQRKVLFQRAAGFFQGFEGVIARGNALGLDGWREGAICEFPESS